MPEIPAEAAPAAVEALQSKRWREDAPWSAHASHRYDSDCAVCGGDVPEIVAAVLEAAAPFLAAQERAEERRKVAEEIAARITGTPKPEEAYWRAWAARIAREIGEAP